MLKYLLENGGIGMKIFLLIISLLLIAIVLLQSNKAEGASQIISGGNSDLFSQRKERGVELLISRVTMSLGLIFFGWLYASGLPPFHTIKSGIYSKAEPHGAALLQSFTVISMISIGIILNISKY